MNAFTCPHCHHEITPQQKQEALVAEETKTLIAACRQMGITISFDGYIFERDAATLTSYSPDNLRKKAREGLAIGAPRKRGNRRLYLLADIAGFRVNNR